MLKYVTLISGAVLILVGCTLSFQNISTHGVASDLVDETQSTDADVTADIKPPVL